MIFDVMIKDSKATGSVNVYRVHDSKLNGMLRECQDNGRYIIAVIPLFRKRIEQPVRNDIQVPEMGEDVLEEYPEGE